MQDLGLSRPLAATLARRGITDPVEAKGFLEGRESHEPGKFEGMAGVVEEVRAAIDDGRKITIYGDFDADGVAATTIMVTALRQLGAECDWFIPDRITEGYGLNPEAIEEIASRGTGLVVTVDCGVTSVGEVALARKLGMGIVVTDHHRTEAVLPDCRILHPVVSGYPFVDLCGAAVAAKLASALRQAAGLDPFLDEADLDLVALATVADVMPLIGENRRLVREGVKVARRAQRPGMRALIAESGLEAAQLSARDFGFRLGPRINAAGRIYRADAGVELFLSDSPERAEEIASELGRANNERRRIEREVEAAAEAAKRELGDDDPAVLVVAGEGWHPGVVGIVASRLVRRHGVPAVVISINGDTARGSARGIPGLDLHQAIAATSDLLEGFGGHAAAAGLQILPSRIDDFRVALAEAVVGQLGVGSTVTPDSFDAVAGGEELALALAEEIETLEPCGKENPTVSLLIPNARITDLREMGEGKHCRFSVISGGGRAAGVSFGRTGFGVDEEAAVDVLAELNVNHWNGSSQPQLVVREVSPVSTADPTEGSSELVGCEPGEWWSRLEVAMGGQTPQKIDRLKDESETRESADSPGALAATSIEGPAEVVLAELLSSGEPLLIITSDARSRWNSLGGAAGLGRLRKAGIDSVRGLWAGSPTDASGPFAEGLSEGVGLSDHVTLAANPDLVGICPNTVVLDPAASPEELLLASSAASTLRLVDPAGLVFAEKASADRNLLTPRLRILYRELRDAGEVSGGNLQRILTGTSSGDDPGLGSSPEDSSILLRVLVEAGLARTEGRADARTVSIVSSEKADLAQSTLFSEQMRIHKKEIAFLRQLNR
ncbi:MAG: single-stranded-DNA-specific exonuclease RecJ [Solirubrobacterales bacterium]